jgi:MFS family permease
VSIGRIAGVALWVTALGVVAGALVGALGGVAFALVFSAWPGLGQVASAGALLGAAFGLLLGPLAGFGVLRDVPLWRAVVTTGCGTLIGILAGVALGRNFLLLPSLAGFALGAAYARMRYSTPRLRNPVEGNWKLLGPSS